MSKEPNRNVYVGHRYVPLLVGEWTKTIDYEGLSIVTHKGASYTSKKRVPVGIDIENDEFWVITGNYNAQVEYYREETNRVSEALEEKADLDEMVNFKDSVNNNINIFKENVNTSNDSFKNSTNEDIENFKENVNASNDSFKNDINSKWSRGYIDVLDFVSTSNGTGDQTTQLQNAIDHASNLKTNLYIPEGHYMVDGTFHDNGNNNKEKSALKVPSNISIIMNRNSIIEVIPNDSIGYSIFGLWNVENVNIYPGILKGEKRDHIQTGEMYEWGHGISILNGRNINILNASDIYDFTGDGIYINNLPEYNNVKVMYNKIRDCRRHEITIIKGYDITIHYNYLSKSSHVKDGIINASYGGMNIDMENNTTTVPEYRIQNVSIKHNHLYSPVNDSILKHHSSLDYHIDISDNYIELGCIKVTNAKFVNVNNNTIKDASKDYAESGIYFRDVEFFNISNNNTENSIASGTKMLRCIKGICNNNHFNKNSHNGILLEESEHVEISKNNIKDSGLTISDVAHRNSILVSESNNITTEDNVLFNSPRGIRFIDTLNSKIIKNNLEDNNEGGILLDDANENVINNNNVKTSSDMLFIRTSNSHRNDIKDNICTKKGSIGDNGILNNNSNINNIEGNRISNFEIPVRQNSTSNSFIGVNFDGNGIIENV